jgi:biopolymer transport protein ExbB
MLSEKIFALARYADQAVLTILLLMSVISIGMIFERYLTLKKISDNSVSVRQKIKNLLTRNDLKKFEELAEDVTTLEGRAASQSLQHLKQNGNTGFEEVFNTFILSEKPELEKYLGALATIASNAPFVGLLGTVLGIMKAFNDLAQSAEAGQQTVMAGISVALVSTAAGLFVAIPAGVFYNYFTRKVKAVYSSLESVKELGLAYSKQKGA